MPLAVIAFCYRKILLVFCWTSALRSILARLGFPVPQKQNTATAEPKYMILINPIHGKSMLKQNN